MANAERTPHALRIAIDGPAASGKGTLGRRLAGALGLRHLDTGLSYRAVAKALLDAGESLDDEAAAVTAARGLDFSAFDRDALSVHEIGQAASKVAVMGKVRQVLVEAQRAFAAEPPGAVLDGRDIGTVVCPDAPVKLYVTASDTERARRRWNEMRLRGRAVEFEDILADVRARDARDTGRADSPLRPAEDAHLLDTSAMTIDEAFGSALAIVRQIQPA